MERRLAAILAADVVEYSRLMARDEEGTLSTLNSHRSAIDEQVARRNGRVFGSAGDSVIAEFASPVEAVRCAVKIQQEIATRNAALPEDKQMRFRIGIHLGDVMAEGDNLLGDGVNIAARLEALAPPEGISISKSVADQVVGKVDVTFANTGNHQLKNIVTPVEVWTWPAELAKDVGSKALVHGVPGLSLRGIAAAAALVLAIAVGWLFWPSGSSLPPNDTPRIAVLPFDDFSTGEDNGWLSDGIAEGLITEIARYPEFLVIARNSSFKFRDEPTGIAEIAAQLNADYVVEGSKQKSGDRLRVTVQLINGADGTHIWADEYDAGIGELFDVQSQIVRSIATGIGRKLAWRPPQSGGKDRVSALHYYWQGNQAFSERTPEGRRKSAELYLKSIETDPDTPFGHAGMATLIWADLLTEWVFPDVPDDELLQRGIDYAERAIALDVDYYQAHIARGDIHMSAGEHEDAVIRYQMAAELNPSSSVALAVASDPLLYLDRVDEAIAVMERAMEINPITPRWYYNNLSRAYWSAGRCEEGAQTIKKHPKPRAWDYRALIVNLVCLGEIEAAQRAGEKLLEQNPQFTLSDHRHSIEQLINNPEYLERWMRALSAAGLPEG